MKLYTALIIVVLAIIGIADASYLTYEGARNIIPPCIPGFQCATVLQSPYAKIAGIPLYHFGLVYYSLVFIGSIFVFLEQPLPAFLRLLRKAGATPLDLLRMLTAIGLLFSIYLVSLMQFVIGAWCTFCLLSAITSLLLFITTRWHASYAVTGESYFIKGLWLNVGQWFYRTFIKPIFFSFDPETVHNILVRTGVMAGSSGISRALLGSVLGYSAPVTVKKLAGITFPNPVGLSAGYDYNADLTQSLGTVGFGWQTIGTVTLDPYEGNAKPRLTRFPLSKSILVNKGLKNIGSELIIQKLSNTTFPIPTGISIASTNRAYQDDAEQMVDIAACFDRFENSPVRHDYYELNISCPNTFGGEPFTTARRLDPLLQVLDKLVRRPIFVKLPIDLPDQEFLSLLAVCDRHQVAGLIIGNLTKDKKNPDVEKSERERWQNLPGNLSGKPTFNRSNRLIALASKKYGSRFVIVGTGGIFSPEDAKIKLAAGADLVQLITGMIYEGPQLIGLINRAIAVPNPEKHSVESVQS